VAGGTFLLHGGRALFERRLPNIGNAQGFTTHGSHTENQSRFLELAMTFDYTWF